MNIGKTLRNAGAKLMLAAALAMPLFGGEVRAEDSGMPLAMRAKAEYTGDFEKPGEFRQTLGLGMPGVYDGRTAVPGQFSENFRAVGIQTDLGNRYMLGARTEPQKFLKNDSWFVPTKSFVWGGFDEEGLAKSIANETQFKAKDTTFSFRQEYQSGKDSLSHFGGTIDQKIGKFTPGFGFDRVLAEKGNTDQIFANLIYEPSQNDFSAVAFSNQKAPDGKESNRVRFELGHYGPKENWGHRSFAEYASSNRGEESLTAHTIVAPFGASTFGRTSNRLLIGNTGIDDDSFKLLKTPYAIYTEDVPEYDRITGDEGFSLKGLGFRADYAISKDPRGDCLTLGGKVLYIGRLGKNIGQNEIGLSIGAVQERKYGSDTTSLTSAATVRLGKHFSIGGSVKAPLNSNQRGYNSNPGATVWGEFKF